MRSSRAIFIGVALAAVVASGASGVDLAGTWYVLVHYEDAGSGSPDQERWEDRVWVFERESGALRWSEYPIVVFDDATGRFERRPTGQQARILHFWEPSPEQRADIADGLRVGSRGASHKTLRGSDTEGWTSARAGSAPSASVVTYSEVWRVEAASDLPVFERRDFLSGARSDSLEGRTRYATDAVHRDGDLLVGVYERDDTRRGTFRMMRSGAIGAPEHGAGTATGGGPP